MMTCQEFADRVSDYLEGRVPYGERIGMWFHALMCKPCHRYLQQMRKTVDFMKEVGDREHEQGAPEDVKEGLMEKFRECRDSDDSSD